LTGIRRGDVRQHAGSMTGLYVGGLLIAVWFAFIPGRTMWHVFFGGMMVRRLFPPPASWRIVGASGGDRRWRTEEGRRSQHPDGAREAYSGVTRGLPGSRCARGAWLGGRDVLGADNAARHARMLGLCAGL